MSQTVIATAESAVNQQAMIDLYKEALEFAYKISAESGRAHGPHDPVWNSVATGKFAELLVQEFRAMIKQTYFETAPQHRDCLLVLDDRVQARFGVKP